CGLVGAFVPPRRRLTPAPADHPWHWRALSCRHHVDGKYHLPSSSRHVCGVRQLGPPRRCDTVTSLLDGYMPGFSFGFAGAASGCGGGLVGAGGGGGPPAPPPKPPRVPGPPSPPRPKPAGGSP